jgi:hypothetical protein
LWQGWPSCVSVPSGKQLIRGPSSALCMAYCSYAASNLVSQAMGLLYQHWWWYFVQLSSFTLGHDNLWIYSYEQWTQ